MAKYQQYAEYKDSGVEWLGEIPTHWEVVPIKHLAILNPKKSTLSQDLMFDECSFVPMEKLKFNSLVLDEKKVIKDVYDGYTYFENQDILVAKVTPCFENNNTTIAKDLINGIGFGSSEIFVLRVNNKVSNLYLFYRLLETIFISVATAAMTGAGGLRRVPAETINTYPIAVPDINEQTQIANFLDFETAQIDTQIEKQQTLTALLKEKRQAVISHAVTKGLNPDAPMKDSGVEWLGDVPEHWEVLAISKLTQKITNGYVGPTRDILVKQGVPYVQATHIKRGNVNFDDAYFVTDTWSKKHSKSILKKGDVLVVQTGAGTGDIGLVTEREEDYNCHALIILQPRTNLILGSYLSLILQSSYGYAVLYSIRTGGMHPHLNCGEVRYVKVPTPTIDEQQKIVEYIESMKSKFDELTKSAQKAIQLMQERRTALISAAVTGKIDVRGWVAPQ